MSDKKEFDNKVQVTSAEVMRSCLVQVEVFILVMVTTISFYRRYFV